MAEHDAKIQIDDIHTRAILGVDNWEREYRQDVLISLSLSVTVDRVRETDQVKDTLDYRSLTKDVQTYVEESKRRTVEALAEDVAAKCLERNCVQRVTAVVEKPDALRDAGGVRVKVTRS